MATSTDSNKTGILAPHTASRNGARLADLLDYGKSATLTLLGDSTGNSTDEWFYLFGAALAADYPTSRVEHLLWDDATQAYAAATILQAGALSSQLSFSDSFTTSSADVYGRTPDEAGNAWARDGVIASGDWSVSGGNLVRTADTSISVVLFGGGLAGDQKVTLTGMNFSTVGDGVATRIFRIQFQYANALNHLYMDVRVSTAGVVTLYLFKMVAGVSTSIGSLASPAAIPGSTASVTGNLVITRSGLNVSATFGASTVSGVILAGDATAIESSTQAGLYGGLGNLIGMTIAAVTMEVTPTASTIQTIRMYNGSMPGATLSYQNDRLALMLPAASDVVFISSSHNYGTSLGPAYSTIVQTFAVRVLSFAADAGIVLSSQNPQKSPASLPIPHASRCQYLRAVARDMGFGYLPVFEEFMKTADWQLLVNSDGVHPSAGASGTGSSLWRDRAIAWLDTHRIV